MPDKLLWIDCTSAFMVGALLITAAAWLGPLLGLPAGFVVAEGVVNLCYGTFSLSLARDPQRSRRRVARLAAMNLAWAGLCATLAIALIGTLPILGTAHFALGAAYVGTLGALEWRWRGQLAGTDAGPASMDSRPSRTEAVRE
jgi:hypothetical protein